MFLVRYCPIWKLIISLSMLLKTKIWQKFVADNQRWVTDFYMCHYQGAVASLTRSDKPQGVRKGCRGQIAKNGEIYFFCLFVCLPISDRPKVLNMSILSVIWWTVTQSVKISLQTIIKSMLFNFREIKEPWYYVLIWFIFKT